MTEVERETRHHIGSLIRRAQQVHAALWAREVSEQVSSVQYSVLAALATRPGASQRELGEEASVDRSTLAELVTRMGRAGLVERVRDEADRRRNALELTASGRATVAALQPKVERLQRLLVADLTDADERELARLLGAVLRADTPAQSE